MKIVDYETVKNIKRRSKRIGKGLGEEKRKSKNAKYAEKADLKKAE